jgi:hypothetical protein
MSYVNKKACFPSLERLDNHLVVVSSDYYVILVEHVGSVAPESSIMYGELMEKLLRI